jgi:predicted nucleic acid-binding protein
MYYFFDSSALIKRYIPETGTAWVQAIAAPRGGNTVVIAQITQIEIVSGAMRRVRNGEISSRTARTLRLRVGRDASREYMVIHLGQYVIEQAQNLLESHILRAYDSVQLASALEANQQLLAAGLPLLVFVSADRQLLTAAAAEGFTTDDPNLHP